MSYRGLRRLCLVLSVTIIVAAPLTLAGLVYAFVLGEIPLWFAAEGLVLRAWLFISGVQGLRDVIRLDRARRAAQS